MCLLIARDPLAQQIRVQTVFHRRTRYRNAGRHAQLDQFLAGLRIVFPATIPLRADYQTATQISIREIQAVANTLNSRPRKTLGWKTPAEALDEYLKSVQQSSVASTG
jgi:hypothetical protein